MNKTAYEMRIIDWSSDVCSSELDRQHLQCRFRNHAAAGEVAIWPGRKLLGADPRRQAPGRDHSRPTCHGLDRESVGAGKSESVRVDLGGRRVTKCRTQ